MCVLRQPGTVNPAMNLTEEYITQKLQAAMRSSTDADGYAEMAVHPDTRLKCAAVLVPLLRTDGEWHLLFTRRTDRVESHKGQVSFPGGACDEGESTPEQTALREADEEIGLRPADVRVLGRLAPMATISSIVFKKSTVIRAVAPQSSSPS